MRVTVMPTRRAKGWDGDPSLISLAPFTADCANPGSPHYYRATPLRYPTLPLTEALEHNYKDDAHLVLYQLGDEASCPRINKTALKKHPNLPIQFGVFMLDIDCPKEEKNVAAWKQATLDKILALPWRPGWKETRGGYHIFWSLPTPLGPLQYEAFFEAFSNRLRGFGLLVDERTKDWTRCFRLPFVHRDGENQHLTHDWSTIGELTWTPPVSGKEGQDYFDKILAVEPRKPSYDLPAEIPSGTRNSELLRYAASLLASRKRSSREILLELILANDERCKPPLNRAEVEKIHASAKRYAEETDPSEILQATDIKVEKIEAYTSNPPVYNLHVEDWGVLKIMADDLLDKKRFQKTFHEAFRFTPKVPTGEGCQEVWRQITNIWLSTAVEIEAPEDANAHQFVVDQVVDWLIKIEARDPYADHLDFDMAVIMPEDSRYAGRKAFRFASLMDSAKMKGRQNNEIAAILRDLGCETPSEKRGRMRFPINEKSKRTKQVRVWIAPAKLEDL